MTTQNEPQTNARSPLSLSADPPWIGFPNLNWGATLGPSFSVRLDPQVNVRRDPAGSARPESVQPSRVKMDKLIEEFAEWNDDLLGELAG